MDSFITHPTKLNTEHCLNRKHIEANCSRCSDSCPIGAITVDHTDIEINQDKCLGCGLCLHICPAEVFETRRWSERTPLLNADELNTGCVEFFCAHHPDSKTGQREIGCVQIPTCLSAMSPGVWFEIGLKKVIRLRLDSCIGCPLENTSETIYQSIDTANAWLRDAGYDAHITYHTTRGKNMAEVQRSVTSGEHVMMSRRGFFRSLFNTAKSISTANSHRDTDETWVGDDSPKNQPRLPRWMAHAASAYAQNARPATTESVSTWPTITVDSTCVHCDACTNYCPTGALQSNISFDVYALTFNPGQCVDCRICWASCPLGAITRSQQRMREPFQRRPVLEHQATSCIHCGRPTEPEKTICYWCAEEPPLDSVMTDARRWLFTNVVQIK